MVAATGVHWDKRIYANADAADKLSCRPDFAIALYPGHLHVKENTLRLNPDIARGVSAHTPPIFLLQNKDDDTDTIWDSLSYEAALIQAKVPLEFHFYATGNQAFGLLKSKSSSSERPSLMALTN